MSSVCTVSTGADTNECVSHIDKVNSNVFQITTTCARSTNNVESTRTKAGSCSEHVHNNKEATSKKDGINVPHDDQQV